MVVRVGVAPCLNGQDAIFDVVRGSVINARFVQVR